MRFNLNNLRQVPKVTELKKQDTKKSDAKKPTPDGSLTRIILDQNSFQRKNELKAKDFKKDDDPVTPLFSPGVKIDKTVSNKASILNRRFSKQIQLSDFKDQTFDK